MVSFAPASTKFNSHENWLKTRNIAWKEIERLKGVDLSKPPKIGEQLKHDIRIEYNKPIDDGFVPDKSTASKIKVPDPISGKKRKGIVYSLLNPINGVKGTFTRVIWNKNSNRWVVIQHFPLAEGWDNAAKNYSNKVNIDANINLP